MDAKEILTKKQFSMAQILTLMFGILYFVFIETDLFVEIPDILKVLAYAVLMVLSAMFGISLVDMKSIGEKMKDILIKRKDMTLAEKIKEWENLAVYVLAKLNEAWLAWDTEQFPEEKPDTYTAEDGTEYTIKVNGDT